MKEQTSPHHGPRDAAGNEAALLRLERDISRSMLRGGSRKALIEDLCGRLVRDAALPCAAVVLWDLDGAIGPAALAGDPAMLGDLARATTVDALPDYGRKALKEPSGLSRQTSGFQAGTIISVRLQHDDRRFGILSVGVAGEVLFRFHGRPSSRHRCRAGSGARPAWRLRVLGVPFP